VAYGELQARKKEFSVGVIELIDRDVIGRHEPARSVTGGKLTYSSIIMQQRVTNRSVGVKLAEWTLRPPTTAIDCDAGVWPRNTNGNASVNWIQSSRVVI